MQHVSGLLARGLGEGNPEFDAAAARCIELGSAVLAEQDEKRKRWQTSAPKPSCSKKSRRLGSLPRSRPSARSADRSTEQMVAAVQHEDGRPGWPEGRLAVWGVSAWKPPGAVPKTGLSRLSATDCLQTSHAITDNVGRTKKKIIIIIIIRSHFGSSRCWTSAPQRLEPKWSSHLGQSCAKVVTSRFPCCLLAFSRWFLGRVFGIMATVVNGNGRSCGALSAGILGLMCVTLQEAAFRNAQDVVAIGHDTTC